MAYQYGGKIVHVEPEPTPLDVRRTTRFMGTCDTCGGGTTRKKYTTCQPCRRNQPPKCGTHGGYVRHVQLGTTKCGPCRKAHTAYEHLRRNPTKMRVQCATYPGYMRHKRANENPCDMCKAAYARYMADYRAQKQAA